jgi:hypothetical protein
LTPLERAAHDPGRRHPLAAIMGSAPNGILADHDARFAEAPRPVRIAGFVAAFLLGCLIAAVALLIFARPAVMTFIEDEGPIDATFVLAVVLGVLLVGLTHRWIRRKIEGRDGSKGA